MISIRNPSFALLANIKRAIDPIRTEALNAENTLTFKAVLDEKTALLVTEGNIVECDNDYFDIVYYDKAINQNGTNTIRCEAEHVSYRLNNAAYNLEEFDLVGTPTQILTALLVGSGAINGTGFTLGIIEPTTFGTYTVKEASSRRSLLMGYANSIGAELSFNKFEVSLHTHRGSSAPVIYTTGKNLKIINKIYDGRQIPALISYTAEPIALPNKTMSLGDEVRLVQPELSVSESLRVISLSFNPMDKQTLVIEISNYVETLENQFYEVAQQTVIKDKLYHGTRIGPEYGFESVRSDKRARSITNSDTLAWQIGDGTGAIDSWANVLWYDSNTMKLYFVGDITMQGGSINWAAEGIEGGVQHDPKLTHIDANGVYTGTLTAEQINAIEGIVLGPTASISWESILDAPDPLQGEPGETGPQGPEGPQGPAGISPTLPTYIQSTFIDSAKIVGPYIYGGSLWATGNDPENDTTNGFYIANGVTGTGVSTVPNAKQGWLSYDTHGQSPDAANRVWLKTITDVALKIESGGNMSIEAAGGHTIYFASAVNFAVSPTGITATAVFGG